MKIKDQKIKIDHQLDNGDFLSSEIRVEYEKGDNIPFCLDEARKILAESIANGRPDVYSKLLSMMGVDYSEKQLRIKQDYYQRLCGEIDKLKRQIAASQEDLEFLFSVEDRLEKLDVLIKEFNGYGEFLELLRASITIGGHKLLKGENK